MTHIEYLTAETEAGRCALAEVMQHSYRADIGGVPPRWARVRLVDGVPVSFILVAPDRAMQFPGGDVPYPFIEDTATREDRRREGHFRALLEDTFAELRTAGHSFVVTHGRHQLYRRFGFEVFTHHLGLFVTPEQIEARLGFQDAALGRELLAVQEGRYMQQDLLLVTAVCASTLAEGRAALQAAAALARERGKARILLEHPSAPSYGSRYPLYPSCETPLSALVRACGGEVRLSGAAPEGRAVPDADWILVLDAVRFVAQATQGLPWPRVGQAARVALATDAGSLTLAGDPDRVAVQPGVRAGLPAVRWPSSALAQLATGYCPAGVLATLHGIALPAECAALLDALFPPRWRFSRNECWTYVS